MAIPNFTDDLRIISKLGNNPGADNGLSPDEFKAKFDEAALLIQNYINSKLLGELNALVDVQALLNNVLDSTLTMADKAANAKVVGDQLKAKLGLSGGSMTGPLNVLAPTQDSHPATKNYVDTRKKTATCTLSQSGWSGSNQTVSVPGVTASNTVIVAPAPDSFTNYRNFGIRCTGQGAGTLDFAWEFPPTADLTVNVLILE